MKLRILILFLATAATAYRTAAQVSVVGGLSYDRVARAGERYEGSFVVRNDSEEKQEAKIYQRDYSFSSDGTNNYGDPGKLPRSNASWMKFSPSYLLLPPKGSATVSYSVALPVDSAGKKLTGSYWSMIMVEAIPIGSPESSIRRDTLTQAAFFQTVRYGVQIATHIGNTGTRSVRFLDARLLGGEGGDRTLQIDIENTGDLWMRPDVAVELFDPNGKSAGKFEGGKFRIYPGTSVRQAIGLKGIKAGVYKALVVVDAGGQDVFGAQYTLQF
jgi:hypothetical protein